MVLKLIPLVQVCVSLAMIDVAAAIRHHTSLTLVPSSVNVPPRYLKDETCSRFFPFIVSQSVSHDSSVG